ncbi:MULTISPECIES: alpha/beta fold hydrolase [Rhodococcus]|uniref:Alpha/beta hydrolase n=1 Tax=Rhodococcus qingshengii JCM 15477 TaxID=1303681 RepID=A0AB38RMC5_RHOSG|nr:MULTISPECIES: alpha/beta hydrolase [Rhodococcus]MDA3635181.1 alpha/beta hydrolase [Rhodococcus sp. C-2]UPU46473.1 alpha/beta hydrolase [Rhodococcus qingshengii JCM 15477]
MTLTPAWFQRALAQHAIVHTLDVDGVAVTCRSWGEPGAPGVVLVHGGAAHARWWDHIAPLLATTRHVVALDLSGHGDSGRRETYSLEAWADEVMAVARDSFDAPPVVIGHSMGGMVTLAAATWHGADLAGAIIIDTPIHEATPEEAAARDKVAFGPQKVYVTREEVVARFRVIPGQDTEPYIFDHIAEHSVRQVGGGWAWKFDPAIFAHEPLRPCELSRLQCSVALLRPEQGLVDTAMGEMISERLNGAARVIDIPAAEHHVMLDQPIALVTGLRVLLACDVSAE